MLLVFMYLYGLMDRGLWFSLFYLFTWWWWEFRQRELECWHFLLTMVIVIAITTDAARCQSVLLFLKSSPFIRDEDEFILMNVFCSKSFCSRRRTDKHWPLGWDEWDAEQKNKEDLSVEEGGHGRPLQTHCDSWTTNTETRVTCKENRWEVPRWLNYRGKSCLSCVCALVI